MEKTKKILNRIFIDGLSGMALGLFSTLIIGTIIAQIGTFLCVAQKAALNDDGGAWTFPQNKVFGIALCCPCVGWIGFGDEMLLDALRQGFTTGGSGVIKYLRSVDILG